VQSDHGQFGLKRMMEASDLAVKSSADLHGQCTWKRCL
jgi:hypothetical protein